MLHRIKSVKPLENLIISVVFQNGVEKTYDIHMLYPQFPQFKVFETNQELFYQVNVDVGGHGVFWNDDLDLFAEDIWDYGIDTGIRHELDVISELAVNLVQARADLNMTQADLAKSTGIYQADISKIERGLANPSVSTLDRLAKGLGMKLEIKFVL